MALSGAEVLIYPTAIGWDPNDTPEEQERQRDAWITIQRSHAITNSLPVISVNRVGFEAAADTSGNGILFWGSSFAAGSQGEILTQCSTEGEQLCTFEIDLERCEEVRRIWPFLRDRRIDAYADLLKRYCR
jgi:N-carbamoylputrescine amidase